MAMPGRPRLRPPRFGLALSAGLIYCLLFIALWLAGDVPLWLAVLLGLGSLGWAAAFDTVLADEAGAAAAVIQAVRNGRAELPEGPRLRLPGMRLLGQELTRLLHLERRRRASLADGAASSQILLERMPDALFLIGGAPGGRHVVWRNPAARSAFGAEEGALLRHPAVRAAIINAEDAPAPVRVSLSLSSPVTRDLEVIVIKAGPPREPAPLYLLIADRTQERSLDRMRADFVANASHELRTPLTSLIGFIETLRGAAADDPEAGRRFLGIMAEQAERMQAVISDLLNLSRIEMAEHQPPEEMIDLPPLLHRATEAMEPMLRTAEASIEREIPPGLPLVAGDAGQLAQVFTNLLDNAIKYGRQGGRITVSARLAGADPRFPPGGVIVAVADDGPGISREHLPRLTERFYRVNKARSRAIGGTGLGLAIVKHVVNRHRGRLLIESTEGKGTTCLVWLPLARGAADLSFPKSRD